MWAPDPILNFGQRLALVRQKMRWNMAEAARECGADPESWRAWEQHGRKPRGFAEVCELIAEAADTDLVWLMTGRLPRLDSNQQPSDYAARSLDRTLATTEGDLSSLSTVKLGIFRVARKPQDISVKRWIAGLTAAGRGSGTTTLRAYWMRRLTDEVGKPPERISRQELVAWLAEGEWSPSTRRSVLATVRGFYAWAEAEGIVKRDIAAGLEAPSEPRPCPKPVAEDRLALALREWAAHEWSWLLRLAASTGMRRAELARAHRDHLEAAGLRVVGKGGVVRVIPVPDDLREWIASQDGWLFPSHTGSHIQPDAVSVRLRKMTGQSAHALRHRYATKVYAETRDLRAVQILLGHATVSTTQRYVAVDGLTVAAAASVGWVA